MPRAYAPNLATVQRAGAVTRALGITRWHLAPGPDVYWRDTDGAHRVPLRTLEDRARPIARCGRTDAHGGHWIGRQPSGAPYCAGNRNVITAR